METKSSWVFLAPIGNLVLTQAVHREFQIEDVIFIDKGRLPYIRRRLGLLEPMSELYHSKAGDYLNTIFSDSQTYAALRITGRIKEIEADCYRRVREAAAILSSSQLGFASRDFASYVGLYGEHEPTQASYAFLNTGNPSKAIGGHLTRNPGLLALTGIWRNFTKGTFFTPLIRIINGDREVSPTWRNTLRQAAILIGQSINSRDLPMSFLRNMIALEMLLTNQGDKYSDVLPKRSEAFLGWVGFWKSEDFESKIKDLYNKRCQLVHRGEREGITPEDLQFSDNLLFNLLTNIVSFPQLFPSKEKVIHFAELVEAEHKLGIRSKVRPKKFSYIHFT